MKLVSNSSRIVVIGGGNIGTQFACTCAKKGYEVNVLTSSPALYSGKVSIVGDSESLTYQSDLHLVTDQVEKAIDGCDIIFITHPASRFQIIADMIYDYIKPGTMIGAIPGTGGAEFAFKKCIEKGAALFGLQRVPGVARLIERGKSVRVSGLRDNLYLASIPSSYAEELSLFIANLFDIPCTSLPNYLAVTLTPSNPILHTSRLYTLFRDYTDGLVYEHNPLFYEEWDDDSSEMLFACDDELQAICKAFDRLDLRNVRSIKMHYESDTPKELTQKMKSIRSLQGLPSPMHQVDAGWVPDFSSRFFSTDFPYGLSIIEELAEVVGYHAENIQHIMNWYKNVTGNDSGLLLSDFGILTKNDVYRLYEES